MSDVTTSNKILSGLIGSLEILMFDIRHSLSNFHKFCGKLINIISTCHLAACVEQKSKPMYAFMVTSV